MGRTVCDRVKKRHAAVFEGVPPDHQPIIEARIQHIKEKRKRVAVSTGQLSPDTAIT